MSCKHMGWMVNQGYWWCNLKNENGEYLHPECKCERCPDCEEGPGYTMTCTAPNGDIITYTSVGWHV